MTAVQLMTPEGATINSTVQDILGIQTRQLSPLESAATLISDGLFERDQAMYDVISYHLIEGVAVADDVEISAEGKNMTRKIAVQLTREGFITAKAARHCLDLLGLTPPKEQNALPITF